MNTTIKRFFIFFFPILLLSGCETSQRLPQIEFDMQGPIEANDQPLTSDIETTPLDVGLLIPQTGSGAAAGNAIFNGAQLALFQFKGNNVNLMPRDTRGAPATAADEIAELVYNEVDFIFGPLFSESFEAAAPTAARADIPVVGFTTDVTVARPGQYIMGFLPQNQVATILTYARQQGHRHIALVTTDDDYGKAIEESARKIARRRDINIMGPVILGGDGEATQNALMNTLNGQSSFIGRRPTAIFLAMPVGQATQLSSFLDSQNMPNTALQRLGTGLWDVPYQQGLSGLNGAWFATADRNIRRKFEEEYRAVYGVSPPRLATLGYDIAALSIAYNRFSAQQDGALDQFGEPVPPITPSQFILKRSGFSGLNGPFRFNNDGTIERNLAVLEVVPGRVQLRAPSDPRFE